ncbi:MAG: hypothetical protein ACRCUS_05575 [Anaerovoracaceae bacterium]
MEELKRQFDAANLEYQELINKDFPNFNLEEYINEKAVEAEQTDQATVKQKKVKTKESEKDFKVFSEKNEKLNIADIKKFSETVVKDTALKAKSIGENAQDIAASIDISEVGDKIKNTTVKVGDTISGMEVSDVLSTAGKIGKTAVGAQGVQNRNAAKSIMKICTEYYDSAEAITEEKRKEINYNITSFGEYRLRTLHETVGRFLDYLKELKQNNAVKEYEVLVGAQIDLNTLDEIKSIDMVASEALRTTAITGVFGAAAVMGTPALVTGTVASLATASTGTAISGLTGAAANSAVLAWLGGGSLAAGGGGMAAGTVALTAITVGATAATAILAAGTLVSLHYGKKLTEAKEYEKDVAIAVANLEKAWVVMDGISRRTEELRDVTEELRWKASALLDQLEPYISEFNMRDEEAVTVFNKTALMIKTVVELAQTPLLNDKGNISTESMNISQKLRKILNTEV